MEYFFYSLLLGDCLSESKSESKSTLASASTTCLKFGFRPEDFQKTSQRVVFEACRDLQSRDIAIDRITLIHHLEQHNQLSRVGGQSAIDRLVEAQATR